MNIKKILFICLILMILSITADSAADSDNINATDSIEPKQAIKPVKTVEHDTNLQPISEKKTVALSNLKATSNSPGTFDDLQLEINNVAEGSVLVLTRDYTGHYGSRIHLDKDITIDGQGHTLNCLDERGCSAFYSTTGNIVLKNIRIVNGHNDYNNQGGAIHIEGSAKYTLENCIFENNWADDYGGAIYNNGDTITIINCRFNGNIASEQSGGAIYSTKETIIENSEFIKNKAGEYGGAVFVRDENLHLKGCIFKSNTADKSGGAVNVKSSIVYIDNCTFNNSWAGFTGGAISAYSVYINTNQSENESFNTYFLGNLVSNSQPESSNGGAIYTSAGGRILNAYFKDNTAKVDGGAIYADENWNLHIDHCLFENNVASGSSQQCYGGAIRAESDVYIYNSTFKNNYAYDYGGAIYAKNIKINHDREKKTSDTFFINNKVNDNDGGAIYAENDVYARNTEFTAHSALVDGGAIYANNNVVTYHCLFESNQANGAKSQCHGGAILAKSDVVISNSTFKDNYAADYGGAIYAKNVHINADQNIETEINSFFINNKANDNDGGAIYVDDSIATLNTEFSKNSALVDGGAIYANKNVVTYHCLFESNQANGAKSQCYGGAILAKSDVVISNSTFKDNYAADYGGAIYTENNVEMRGSIFESNRANDNDGGAICAKSDVYIHNSTFKNNYAYDYGGAIYANNVRINHDREGETADTFFIDNKAKDNDGGAIYAENDVYARNIAFINNTAYVDGGAIYAGKNVEVIQSIFESNQATGAPSTRCYGGAIRAEENAKINNCTFKNNYAENRGGAVHASTVTLEGDKNTFEGNTAKDYGGAIYTDTITNPVSNVSFINNKAEAGDGGAVYINNKNWIPFTECAFINNRAAHRGGAIYLDSVNSHLIITDNVFINNIADNGGHTVFNSGYYDIISDNYWTINPTTYNNQLVKWKALSSNIQHTDSNPVRFTIEIIGECSANVTSGVKISFVHPDGTPATLPMIAEYFSMSDIEGIETGDKEVSSDGITIWFTPTEVGTYELPTYILGMTGIITINVID